MSKSYIIRSANLEDEENILKLSRSVADNYTRSYLGDQIVDWYIDSDNCDEDIRKDIKSSTLLLHDDKIIGIMDCTLIIALQNKKEWLVTTAHAQYCHILTENQSEIQQLQKINGLIERID